jgi:hypothetical protein
VRSWRVGTDSEGKHFAANANRAADSIGLQVTTPCVGGQKRKKHEAALRSNSLLESPSNQVLQSNKEGAEPISVAHPEGQNPGGNAPARRKGELQYRDLFCPALVISPKRLKSSPPHGERPQPIQQSRIGVAYD